MSKQFWYSKKLVIVSLTTLFSATLASPAFARTYEFVFGNYTGQDLVGVYWRAAFTDGDDAGSWENNSLSEGVLSDNGLAKFVVDGEGSAFDLVQTDETVIYPDDCYFDVRGVSSNGAEVAQYGINLCEVASIGFFDFVDTATFYEGGGREVFITNDTSFPLVELVFQTLNDSYFLFGFGDSFNDELEEELNNLPTPPSIPPEETELFLVDLPTETDCNYQVAFTFWDETADEPFEAVTESLDFCSDYDEIKVSGNGVSLGNFPRRNLTVINNTSYSLVTLEIAPSFRPELWSSVIRSDFIAPGTETTYTAAAIQLNSNDEQERCFYDIYGILVTDEDTAEQIPVEQDVEQYFVDLCAADSKLTFREGVVLD